MTRFHAAAAAILALTSFAVAGDDAARPAAGRLEAGGGSLAGDLEPAPEVPGGARDTLLWKSPRFAAPFEFHLGEVSGVAFAAPARRPEAAGPFVHLRGGDVLAATIESLDADAMVVGFRGPDGPARLWIARGEVAAISRACEGGGSYVGPSGLAGWDQAPAGSWREEAGRIMTDKAGAAVTRDVAATGRARYDIRMSRRRAAEFRLAVAAAERPADDGYVLHAVGGDAAGGMMLVRRGGGRAAIEPLPAVEWRGDALRVVLFVDQERGRLAAVLPEAAGAAARQAHEVRLPAGDGARPSGRFRLELTGGDLCLERIEVTPWRGEEPTLRPVAETAIVARTGPLEGFAVTSFEAAPGEYVLTRGGETRRVAAADVEEIRFPVGDEAAAEGAVRVVAVDGSTLTGDLVKVDDRAVWVRRRGVDAAVAVPRDGIVAIRSLQPLAGRQDPAGRVGTLVVGEDRIRGCIVGRDGTEGVAWRPLGSANAAALAGAVDAEVEYVQRRPEKRPADAEVGGMGALVDRDGGGFFAVAMMTEDGAAARDGRIAAGDRIVAIAPAENARFVETRDLDNETVTQLLRGRVGTIVRLKVTDGAGANPRDVALARGPISVAGREVLEQALQAHARLAGAAEVAVDPRAEYPAVVVLRSGDTAPCRIESIDADAVTLRSPLAADAAEAVRVPAALVKAVELLPTAASRTLDKTLRDRLLTQPRMQRDRPPTHLLRLVDGDYLRGRLVRVDDASVSFDVRDVVKQLPRSQVARLIWLHPETPPPEGGPAAGPEPEPEGLVVQGVAADGRRVTLVAGGVEGNLLRGHSRAFGTSVVDLARIDRLLLGGAIGRDSRELPFAQWRLKPAAEPKALAKPAEP
ncbi:MAG: hypothetical protein ACKOZU_01415 [Planctomycetaceae bacterium]